MAYWRHPKKTKRWQAPSYKSSNLSHFIAKIIAWTKEAKLKIPVAKNNDPFKALFSYLCIEGIRVIIKDAPQVRNEKIK
jgi:hypothetical protein